MFISYVKVASIVKEIIINIVLIVNGGSALTILPIIACRKTYIVIHIRVFRVRLMEFIIG